MKQNLVKLAADYRRDVDKYLRELKISEKEMNLHEPMMYSATAPGKRIRPLLTLFTGTGLGADRKALLPIAVSVELLHTFTLVHDDIMDNDTQRRGLPTVHVKWDQNTAILAGDGLMALAFRVLMESRAARIRQMGYEFSQAMLEICEGQVLDMGFESRMDVNREAYLEMVGKKTGRLLGLSCQLGGLAADADEKIIHNLNAFGIELGQIFQIQDDLLEITSDVSSMGKSLDSDIVSGKKTFPLILRFEQLSDVEKTSFLTFMKENVNNRSAIIDDLTRSGVIDETAATIGGLNKIALDRLSDFPEKLAEHLKFLVLMIAKRQH
ncbi:MAG: polyprenyl synthetase family protein [Candidatus Marinimicrobia bacterium]|nr:polyprenyl synthetase family protein [Candidatus Neomarinimicrobiota bacterium]RKY62112.1 MAG: polyprenyl synthetase family protein [Candidatus Neomarinimicrobiota bacterium]